MFQLQASCRSAAASQRGHEVRIANQAGRTVVVSPDAATCVDLATASDGRFGPEPRAVFNDWDNFAAWASTATIDFAGQGSVITPETLQAPSPEPRQIFAIGLNYRDHADESGIAYPEVPPTFTKWVGSFAGPVGELRLPAETVDWEAELVVIIGRKAEAVAAADAWDYIAGLTVGQDYSERTLQLAGPAPQFSLGKSYVGFAPQGPWLVTPDELVDPTALAIECRINGETVQKSETDRLIFSVGDIVEHLSKVMPLLPGDVIFTGTPAGVGGARKPPRFLKVGDVVETTIEGLGGLRQVCVAATD